MTPCSNATDIFALAFSVNAIFSVFGLQARNAVRVVSDCFDAEFKSIDSSFSAVGNDRIELERWVRLTVNGLRWGHTTRFIPLGTAIFFVVVSVATLLQRALYGDKCEIDDSMLILFTVTSLFVAPMLYYGYSEYLKHVCRLIVTRRVETPELRLAWLDMFRFILKSRNDLRQLDKRFRKITRQEAERDFARLKRELWERLQPVLHPIQAFRSWRHAQHLKQVLANISANELAPSNTAVEGALRDKSAQRPST